MQITGVLKVKMDTYRVSDRFQKRNFVLTTTEEPKYPQHPQFQLAQEKCVILDIFEVGDTIEVEFKLKGREWNGPQGVQYFNILEAISITKVK